MSDFDPRAELRRRRKRRRSKRLVLLAVLGTVGLSLCVLAGVWPLGSSAKVGDTTSVEGEVEIVSIAADDLIEGVVGGKGRARALIPLKLGGDRTAYCYFPPGSADDVGWQVPINPGDTLIVSGRLTQGGKYLVLEDCRVVRHRRSR